MSYKIFINFFLSILDLYKHFALPLYRTKREIKTITNQTITKMQGVTKEAEKRAEREMFGIGLKKIFLHDRIPTKTRFYASALYIRYSKQYLIEFTFNLQGRCMKSKVVDEIWV